MRAAGSVGADGGGIGERLAELLGCEFAGASRLAPAKLAHEAWRAANSTC
jgi:hypothetical protein